MGRTWHADQPRPPSDADEGDRATIPLRALADRARRVVESIASVLTGAMRRAKIGSVGQSTAAWRRSTAVWKP